MTKKNNEKPLKFQIAQPESSSKDNPLNDFVTIHLKAVVFGIDREIPFGFFKRINVKYPVQIGNKINVFSRKNITRISWKLSNISSIDLGSKSKSRRVVKVQVIVDKLL